MKRILILICGFILFCSGFSTNYECFKILSIKMEYCKSSFIFFNSDKNEYSWIDKGFIYFPKNSTDSINLISILNNKKVKRVQKESESFIQPSTLEYNFNCNKIRVDSICDSIFNPFSVCNEKNFKLIKFKKDSIYLLVYRGNIIKLNIIENIKNKSVNKNIYALPFCKLKNND